MFSQMFILAVPFYVYVFINACCRYVSGNLHARMCVSEERDREWFYGNHVHYIKKNYLNNEVYVLQILVFLFI